MALESVTLPVVVGTALIDSINPCAIGVLLLLLGVLVQNAGNKARILAISLIYIVSVFVVYLISGLGLVGFQYVLITLGLAAYLGVLVGILVIALGLIELKDFLWYGKGITLAIPSRYVGTITRMAQNVSAPSAIALGILVSLVELPCTGGPYLAITTLLAERFDMRAFWYLVLYNFIFVLPLIILSALAYFGVAVGSMRSLKAGTKRYMRLAAGIVLITLGVFLIGYYLGWFL